MEPMNISTMVGNFYLDLTDAYIPDEETEINIRSLAGDVTILIPGEVEFQAKAAAKAGDINILDEESTGINTSLFYKTDQFETATKKLFIDIRLKAGSIRVDQYKMGGGENETLGKKYPIQLYKISSLCFIFNNMHPAGYYSILICYFGAGLANGTKYLFIYRLIYYHWIYFVPAGRIYTNR